VRASRRRAPSTACPTRRESTKAAMSPGSEANESRPADDEVVTPVPVGSVARASRTTFHTPGPSVAAFAVAKGTARGTCPFVIQ
jgi:hypothetical protein